MLKGEATSALPALVELAQSSENWRRETAYGCIARLDLDWDRLWPALIPVLHSRALKVRVAAAEFLYRLHPEEARRAGVFELIPPISEL